VKIYQFRRERKLTSKIQFSLLNLTSLKLLSLVSNIPYFFNIVKFLEVCFKKYCEEDGWDGGTDETKGMDKTEEQIGQKDGRDEENA